ncbi:MAG: hypothetical protein NC433_03755 [Clostridiales bacterium]|nr:hypothetical protein [Clostridiales bacterium]
MKKNIYNKMIVVFVIVAAVIMVGILRKDFISAYAEEGERGFIPRSYGRLTYNDADVSNNNGHENDLLIDTADFVSIAECINRIYGITDELNAATVKKSDILNSLDVIKENDDGEKIVGANALKEFMQDFQAGVNKIYDKLSGLGFTPVSNSPDDINNAIQDIYDSRYAQGYTDGAAHIQSATAQIIYTYHQHTGSESSYGGCYTVLKQGTTRTGCTGNVDYDSGPYGPDITGNMYYAGNCDVCGGHYTSHSKGVDKCPNGRIERYEYYDLGCGMSTNTIIHAEIKFVY